METSSLSQIETSDDTREVRQNGGMTKMQISRIDTVHFGGSISSSLTISLSLTDLRQTRFN